MTNWIDRLPRTPYCADSTGELDWSEFDPKLLARELALRQDGSDEPAHPYRCGHCTDCREFLDESAEREQVLVRRRHMEQVEGLPSSLTVKAFLRHAQRFGLDFVAKTARDYLGPAELTRLEVELALLVHANGLPRTNGKTIVKPKRRRRTTPGLRRQVAEMRDRGLLPVVIADALNISDRRCRQLLSQLGNRPNRARKPFIHAEVHVD